MGMAELRVWNHSDEEAHDVEPNVEEANREERTPVADCFKSNCSLLSVNLQFM